MFDLKTGHARQSIENPDFYNIPIQNGSAVPFAWNIKTQDELNQFNAQIFDKNKIFVGTVYLNIISVDIALALIEFVAPNNTTHSVFKQNGNKTLLPYNIVFPAIIHRIVSTTPTQIEQYIKISFYGHLYNKKI